MPSGCPWRPNGAGTGSPASRRRASPAKPCSEPPPTRRDTGATSVTVPTAKTHLSSRHLDRTPFTAQRHGALVKDGELQPVGLTPSSPVSGRQPAAAGATYGSSSSSAADTTGSVNGSGPALPLPDRGAAAADAFRMATAAPQLQPRVRRRWRVLHRRIGAARRVAEERIEALPLIETEKRLIAPAGAVAGQGFVPATMKAVNVARKLPWSAEVRRSVHHRSTSFGCTKPCSWARTRWPPSSNSKNSR